MCECQRKKCLVGILVEHTSNISSLSRASLWPQVVSTEELSGLLTRLNVVNISGRLPGDPLILLL